MLLLLLLFFSVGYDGDGGDFGRTLKEEEEVNSSWNSPSADTPCSTAGQSYVQVDGFCMTTEDQKNEGELCKMDALHCQGTYLYILAFVVVQYI